MTNVEELDLPDSVLELCDGCFDDFRSLRRLTFGAGSKLERIGNNAFFSMIHIKELEIPDSLRELGNHCFSGCVHLKRVTFSASSKLERIGELCFANSSLESLSMPSCVSKIGGGIFSECPLEHEITCCEYSAFLMPN